MVCGIVVVICFMIFDHAADPLRELDAAHRALSQDWSAANVERLAEAHVAANRHDDSIYFYVSMLSQDQADPRIVTRLAEVFDEWFAEEGRSEISTTQSKLRIANTAAGELSKYPGTEAVLVTWRRRVETLTEEYLREGLDLNRPIMALERLRTLERGRFDLPALERLRAEVITAALPELRSGLEQAVRFDRWENAAKFADWLAGIDSNDPTLREYGARVFQGLLRRCQEAVDLEGAKKAAERLLEFDPENADAKRALSSG